MKERGLLRMVKGLVVGFLLALISGCMTTNIGGHKSESEVRSRLLGMEKPEVAALLGAPNDRVSLEDGLEVWTYRVMTEGLKGGQCSISLSFEESIIRNVTINKSDRSPLAAPMGSCQPIIGKLN